MQNFRIIVLDEIKIKSLFLFKRKSFLVVRYLVYLGFIFFGFVLVSFFLFCVYYIWSFWSLRLVFSRRGVERLFLIILCLVSALIWKFSSYYLEYELFLRYFYCVLVLFILRIGVLVLSRRLFLVFVGWDGLGVTSFFLVLFYLNSSCVRRRIITIITNRVGDVLLFWWRRLIIIQSLGSGFALFVPTTILILIVAALTKSAQYPFCSWLPKAIRAPTPISALVHSRTLVTAGVFFNIKIFFSLLFFFIFSSLVLFSGVFTLLTAGITSLFEPDAKRVVALSTLRQIAFFLFVGLSLKCYSISLFHLISHAIFKRNLFIQLGYFIHQHFRGQDSRTLTNRRRAYIKNSLIISLISLCGVYFRRGFIRKELILNSFISRNLFFWFLLPFLGGCFFFNFFILFSYFKINSS